jgi:hypothetical protein
VSDSNVIKLTQPGAFTDSLTEILRSGAASERPAPRLITSRTTPRAFA